MLDPVSALLKSVAPEAAPLLGLNPSNLHFPHSGGDLLDGGWIGLAAIGQVRKINRSVPMDIVDSQPLPVGDDAIQIADHPCDLRDMMVDGCM